jgi:hypothetical protein
MDTFHNQITILVFNQIIFQISLMFCRYHCDYVWCFVIEDKGPDGSMS